MAKGKYERWLQPENLLKITAWARDGLVDTQIAHNMGIAEATLYEWKKKYPEITEALKIGKEVVDIQVENALLKRALGYKYTEVKEEHEDGVLTKRTVTVKEVVPDTTAQIYWLQNRRPDVWKDRRKVDMQASIDIEDLTPLGEMLKL